MPKIRKPYVQVGKASRTAADPNTRTLGCLAQGQPYEDLERKAEMDARDARQRKKAEGYMLVRRR
jgi:hypothetical protein